MSISLLEKKLYPKMGSREYLILRAIHSSLISQWCLALQEPMKTQQNRLSSILRNIKNTKIGNDYQLHSDMSLHDFRNNVPISNYTSYYNTYLQDVHHGKSYVINSSPITACMESSGTTGQPKWIPITRSWEDGVLLAQKLWITSMIKDFPQAARGQSFSIVSKAFHGQTSGGIPIGSNTGRMLHRQPWYIKRNPIYPNEVLNIVEQDALQYTILRFALQSSISVWTTANPSTILLYCRRLQEWREELSKDLLKGTLCCGPASQLSTNMRHILEQKLRPTPLPQKWMPAYIWPLAVVNCWKGGPAQYFASQISKALGHDIPIREVGVSASEGHFSVPMSQHDEGGALWTMGHVIEFIDEDEVSHWAWEVQKGNTYRLVITTESGLLRYDLQDLVEVTGFTGATPNIRFVGKSGSFLNAVGEKVAEEQISHVLKSIDNPKIIGCTVRIYWDEVPHYILAVEGDIDPIDFCVTFDTLLQQQNLEYESKRKSGRLGMPTYESLPQHFYLKNRMHRVKQGSSDAQVKDVIICDEDTWKEYCFYQNI